MVMQVKLATRPAVTEECTCLWRERLVEHDIVPSASIVVPALLQHVGGSIKSALYPPVKNVIGHVPGGYPTESKVHNRMQSNTVTGLSLFHTDHEDSDRALAPALDSRDRNEFTTSQTHLVLQPERRPMKGNTDTKKQLVSRNSPLADRPVPDLLVRRIKKNLRKSSEHKLRELVSYKAEILNTLQTLVPKRVAVQPSNVDLRVAENNKTGVRSEFDQTWLCEYCLTQLKTYLYYSPTSRSPYLYEHSVPAYLALLDDAILAVKSDSIMEQVTHHELNSILMAELSVVEWRLSLKLARFHRKTGYLGVFPMEVGPFANLEIKRTLNKPEEGLLTIVWRKIKSIGGN